MKKHVSCICAAEYQSMSVVVFYVCFEFTFFFCFTRLQHSNLSEPKSLRPSKQTAAPQEYNQDTAKIDKVMFKVTTLLYMRPMYLFSTLYVKVSWNI